MPDDSTQTSAVPLVSVAQVSAGYAHTCALKTDGTVVCRGTNFDPWNGGFSGQSTVPPGLSLTNRQPVPNAGPDQIVEATSPAGASVVLDGAGSSDPDGDALSFKWTGLFGSANGPSPEIGLPLGTHTVTLTVNDGHVVGSFTVLSGTRTVTVKVNDGRVTPTSTVTILVRDITSPITTITSAADGHGDAIIAAGSTLSNGAQFTFGATDAVGVVGIQCSLDNAAYVACSSPVAYTSLSIGTHNVRVIAADGAGNVSGPATFTWKVITPAQAVQNLSVSITALGLAPGVANSLSAPLQNIDMSNLSSACGKLNAFVSQVNAKVRSGQLATSAGSQLTQAVNAIINSLGCR